MAVCGLPAKGSGASPPLKTSIDSMKTRLLHFFLFVVAGVSALAQTRTLTVESPTGPTEGPVSASTFRSASGRSVVEFGIHDVVVNYKGSGSATTTTGDIGAGSTSLVVANASTFAVGQGICIKGAGPAGTHHVTRIAAIARATITLTTAAAATVNDAVVQHDDTAAINAAIAACHAAGGGTVYLRAGRYRVAAPLNRRTNSLITYPQDIGYSTTSTIVRLIGEVRGRLNRACTSIATGGVTIDATDAPAGAGAYPAVISIAPYVQQPQQPTEDWNCIHAIFDRLLIVTASDSTLSGIMASNTLRLTCGDELAIICLADTEDGWVAPTHDTVGLYCPQLQNNYDCGLGWAHIINFDVGLITGEHMEAQKVKINFCNTGVLVARTGLLTAGSFIIEMCPEYIRLADGTSIGALVDFRLETEDKSGEWYSLRASGGIVDPENLLRGRIAYAASRQNVGYIKLPKEGATKVTITNLHDLPASAVPAFAAQWNLADLTDASGNENALADHGTVTFAAGKIGKGAVFNGTDQYLTADGEHVGGVGANASIAFWMKADMLETAVVLSEWGSDGGVGAGYSWQFVLDANGRLSFSIYTADSRSRAVSAAAGTIKTGTWYFVCGRVDSANKTFSLRVNAGSDVEDNFTGTTWKASTLPITLGCNYDASGGGASYFFDGMIDAVRILKLLSDGQVSALYDSGRGTED